MNQIKPMLLTTLKSYDRSQFVKDVTAGIIVAIIALPLSIALGSSVQIAGPTAALPLLPESLQKTGLTGL